MKLNIFLQVYLKFKKGWSGEHTGNVFLRISQLLTISQLTLYLHKWIQYIVVETIDDQLKFHSNKFNLK